MRINQNIAAFNAYRNLNQTQNSLSGSLEKLSSGFRINRAADDASGLVNSENLRSQIGGLETAQRNAQDAISLVQTAEGAQTEVHSMLQRMRDLTVQSGNIGTNDEAALKANQDEIDQLKEELDRIAKQTQFGTQKILDGNFAAGEVKSAEITMDDMDLSALAGGTWSVDVSDGTDTVTVTQGDVTATDPYAVVGELNTALSNGSVDASFSLTQDGRLQLTSDATGETAELSSSVNTAGATGFVTETASGEGWEAESASIEANSYTTATANATIGFDLSVNGETETLSVSIATGDDIDAAVTKFQNAIDAEFDGVTVGKSGGALTFATNEAGADQSIEISAVTNAGETGLVATSDEGRDGSDQGGAVFQVGANAGQTVSVGINSVSTDNLGSGAADELSGTVDWSSIADVDLTELSSDELEDGISDAIKMLDDAIGSVSTNRAELGAFQNRMESTIRNVGVAVENLSAAESRIRDTDMANEMVNFTRNQILQQAGTSMLAQANQVPQSVLSLLQ